MIEQVIKIELGDGKRPKETLGEMSSSRSSKGSWLRRQAGLRALSHQVAELIPVVDTEPHLPAKLAHGGDT